MEFTLEAGELARIVGLVKGMVPARTTIPILSNILIEAADGSVNIRATCLDMEASASAIAEVVTPGAVTVPGHVLHSLAKSLPKTKLATFKLDDGSRPVLTCGKSRYELRALDPGDFPSANPIGKSAVRFSMPGPDLVALLAGTLPSVETDAKTRYYLCGVFLHVYKDNLVAVSTDGHRMARIASDVPPGAAGMPAIIIPTGAAQEIVAMAGDSDVDIAITPTCIEVMTDKSRLWSKLVDGTYPDYQRVIPVRSNTVASVDRD